MANIIISETKKGLIQTLLEKIERNYEVEILMAIESGSRAYGFASKDSDYDIRFIYKNPLPWYITIENKRDVIEFKHTQFDLDFAGWDIKKALYLLYKSNPSLLEWVSSPVYYKEIPDFQNKINDLIKRYYNPRSCFYHYLGLAEGHIRRYLKVNAETISGKKYFYILRAILSCYWILEGAGRPGLDFEELLMYRGIMGTPVGKEILKLLEQKKKGSEIDHFGRNEILDQFLDEEMEHFKTIKFEKEPAKDKKFIDRTLWNILVMNFGGMREWKN